MVSRQPSVAITFRNSMPQPNKFRNLVARYLNGNKSRRKRLTREFVPVTEMSPPPPPPKDMSYHEFTGSDDVDADKSRLSWALPLSQQPNTIPTPSSRPRTTSQPFTPPPRRADLPQMLSPAEIRRRREEASKTQTQMDTVDPAREEAEHQERLRLEKEAAERQLRIEEERRRMLLEEDLRLAAVLRKQKEERERREEEERHQKIEERRRADRERRMRQAQKQQEWRLEQARLADETMRRKIELRSHVHEDRRMRSWADESSVIYDESQQELFRCWVNVQRCDNVSWKRRFCRVIHTRLALFKDPSSSQPMETINISLTRGVHERMDGHEELEGLDHAFMLDMHDGTSYILFTDNDGDKETLASLVVQTAGI